MTELAISLPILFLFIFGLIELGFMIKTKMVLQDAARSALRFGMLAGFDTGQYGCEADYAVLDTIQNRLTGSLADTNRVRSVFIYAATSSGDTPTAATSGGDDPVVAPHTTEISGATLSPPIPGVALYGDYYYADYNTSNGQDADTSGATNTGTGRGAIYKLFHDSGTTRGVDTIFASAAPSITVNNDTDGDNDGGIAGYSDSQDSTNYLAPDCGSTMLTTSASTLYDDSSNNGTYAGPSYKAGLLNNTIGNWPPAIRNNQQDFPTGLPDAYGVDIVYDYQFHTPIFQVIANVFLGGTHTFRMDERTSDYLSPQ